MERPMNTASRDRVVHKSIAEYIDGLDKRRTPVTRIKLVRGKGEGASVSVLVHTSRPQVLRPEADGIAASLKEEFGGSRDVKVEIIAEARAVAKFVRTSPRKARLIIDAIKGKRVSEALALLRFIPNHAAEPLSKVLLSAAANAQDGWGAIPEELKVANIIADGGPILKRVQARAQGRAYRINKRTSHLTVVLTEMPAPTTKRRVQGKPKAKPVPKTTIVKTKAPAPKVAAAPAAPVDETPAADQTAIAETAPVEQETPAAEMVEAPASSSEPAAETGAESAPAEGEG